MLHNYVQYFKGQTPQVAGVVQKICSISGTIILLLTKLMRYRFKGNMASFTSLYNCISNVVIALDLEKRQVKMLFFPKYFFEHDQ